MSQAARLPKGNCEKQERSSEKGRAQQKPEKHTV